MIKNSRDVKVSLPDNPYINEKEIIKNSKAEKLVKIEFQVVYSTEVQFMPLKALTSHKVMTFSISYPQRDTSTQAGRHGHCWLYLLFCSHFIEYENVLFDEVLILQSFKHSSMTSRSLHKVKHMLDAFQDLETDVSTALGKQWL